MPFGVPSGRVCIILYGYNGARDEKTKWRRRKFPSGIYPEEEGFRRIKLLIYLLLAHCSSEIFGLVS